MKYWLNKVNHNVCTCFQTQFCLAFIHSIQLLFYDCGYPRWSLCFTGPNAIFFYYLFADFYNKAYTKGKSEKESYMKNSIANGNNFVFRNCVKGTTSVISGSDGNVAEAKKTL